MLGSLASLLSFKTQPLGDFLGVALVVEPEEAAEHFAAGGLADREPEALLRLVEAVAEVRPAVGGATAWSISTCSSRSRAMSAALSAGLWKQASVLPSGIEIVRRAPSGPIGGSPGSREQANAQTVME